MPKIVGARERLGRPYFGAYLSDSGKSNRTFRDGMNLFDPYPGRSNADSESLLAGHKYWVQQAAFYADTSDPDLAALFLTDMRAEVVVSGRPVLYTDQPGPGWTIMAAADPLAEMRGEMVIVSELELFGFFLHASDALVRAVGSLVQTDGYVELLGWVNGVETREVL